MDCLEANRIGRRDHDEAKHHDAQAFQLPPDPRRSLPRRQQQQRHRRRQQKGDELLPGLHAETARQSDDNGSEQHPGLAHTALAQNSQAEQHPENERRSRVVTLRSGVQNIQLQR
jgi:hypothetical protein